MARLGRYGATTPKPLRLWRTAHWAQELHATRPIMDVQDENRLSKTRRTSTGARVVDRQVDNLGMSQAYPQEFGEAVARLAKKHLIYMNLAQLPDQL